MSYAGHTVVASPSASASDDAAAMDVSPNDAADDAVASVSNSDGSAAVVGGRAADAMACVRDAAVVTAALMRPGVSSDVVIRGIKHIVSCTTHSFAHPWLLSGTPDQCKGTVPSRSAQSFTYAPSSAHTPTPCTHTCTLTHSQTGGTTTQSSQLFTPIHRTTTATPNGFTGGSVRMCSGGGCGVHEHKAVRSIGQEAVCTGWRETRGASARVPTVSTHVPTHHSYASRPHPPPLPRHPHSHIHLPSTHHHSPPPCTHPRTPHTLAPRHARTCARLACSPNLHFPCFDCASPSDPRRRWRPTARLNSLKERHTTSTLL
jgi:hypothetical protein